MNEQKTEKKTRPFKMIDGRRWELAEDEQWDESEPEQLSLIPPAPREVSFPVQMRLLFASGLGSSFGLFFACFGLAFALFPVYVVGLHGAVPRKWTDAGKGKIVKLDNLNMTPGKWSYDRFHFTVTGPDGKEFIASCRRQMEPHQLGDEVALERSGTRYRIKGMKDQFEVWAFIGMGTFFGLIGLSFVGISFFFGRRKIDLLQNGQVGIAHCLGTKPTGMVVNGQSMMKVLFQYEYDGQWCPFHLHTLESDKLTDGKTKILFYEPSVPQKAIVLESLRGVTLDEFSGRFQASLWPSLFPMTLSVIVSLQFIALVGGIIAGLLG